MTYDDLSRTLTVKPWRDSQFGSFTLHVNLTDADGVSRYYRMDIEVIKGQELPQEEPEEAVKSNSSTEVVEEPYTKYVEFSCSKSNQYSNYTYGQSSQFKDKCSRAETLCFEATFAAPGEAIAEEIRFVTCPVKALAETIIERIQAAEEEDRKAAPEGVDKKPIYMNIVEVQSNGKVTIGFSEKLKSIKYFQAYGLNLTVLNEISHSILDVNYICK